ncbi:MAG: GGDEF domain-containing protein [Candidatus Auribacterota bacterium]
MPQNSLNTVVQIHKIFKELMHLTDIKELMHCFMRGVNRLIDIRYCGIFLCHDRFPLISELEKNYIIVGHRADFHNALWNTIRQSLRESYANFAKDASVEVLDFENVELDVFQLDVPKERIKDAGNLDVVFQMPLVINNTIIGVMIFVDHSDVELSLNDLTTIGLISDQFTIVSEKLLLVDEIQELAIKDFLTGVYNRRHFMERFSQEFARCKRFYTPMTLVMADIDHFKKVNDTYGHLAGDAILVRTSQIIADSLRKIDVVARYGGEEFVMLLPYTNHAGALTAVRRIRTQIDRAEFIVGDQIVKISISFGISSFPDNNIMEEDEFILSADNALYGAKSMGRDCICQYTEEAIVSVQ